MPKWTEAQLAALQGRRDGEAKIGAGRAKYRNKKTTVDGTVFDSKAEAHRYIALKRLEMARQISQLKCQVPYALEVNGVLICRYVADFVYLDGSGARIVEDVKGVRTRDYILKRKLMKACHGIEILETRQKKATARPKSARTLTGAEQ